MKYIIENENIKAEISELGATLVKFIYKKTNTDIVLGFDSDEDYLKNKGPNIGASVGRNANRIGNGKITINDVTYQLTINDNMNQLHGGGINGFAFKMWNLINKKDDEITLHYFSKDQEEGFPGNVDVYVTYKIENNSLIWSYEATTDKDTLINMTNHSYFNLGDEDILSESLYISTDKYSPIDEYSLTKDEVLDVKDTPFDFREYRLLKNNLSQTEKGIDNNYVWENMNEKLMAKLKNNKIELSIYSDLPDMHLYTGYYLGGEKGKYNKTYHKYSGLCLECQYYPNGINYKNYIVPIVKANERIKHYIKYELKDCE